MKYKTFLASLCLIFGFASPSLAFFYSDGSRGPGDNMFSFQTEDGTNYEMKYTAKSGNFRITGSGTGVLRQGVIRGRFTENLSDGTQCSGTFISQYPADYVSLSNNEIEFFITGGRGCAQVGESPSVTFRGLVGTLYRSLVVFHDPSDNPLERLNIRDAPNGRKIGYALSGDTAVFEAREGDWLLLRVDGLTGWVHESLIIFNTR